MDDWQQNLENLMLKTLSFNEAMTMEMILIDLDETALLDHRELNTNDLQSTLNKLVKMKRIKTVKKNGDIAWIKIFPNSRRKYKYWDAIINKLRTILPL